MDASLARVTLERVTKPPSPENRRRAFRSSEWDLDEPPAFARLARNPFELALITGILMRLFRAVVLTHGNATTTYLGAALVLGTLFLLAMATLHLGRFPVREWPYRAPLFAIFETVGEMLVSLILIALHREPWGTARAEFVDWQAMATGVVFWRVLGVSVWALMLGLTVSFIRGRVLKETGREVEPQTLPDGQPFIERRKSNEL
jgi:Na+-transporting methylmalonyl-CoA/oxaloacetate decarboxylase gamma subunit